MSKFGSKEDILRAIETQFTQMQSNRMSMEDLESLVEHARELYERTLILRYKAYEDKVFGEAKEVLEQPEPTSFIEETSAPEPEWMDETPEPKNESESLEEQQTSVEPELEPVFDLALFDEQEEKEMPVFQLDIEEKTDNEASEQTEMQAEEETPFNAEPDLPTEQADESQEPVASVEKTAETQEYALGVTVSEEEDPFKAILQTDDSLGSRFMLSKLDTLVGSFGFNEKFQCVQELFGGSGDDFNQAIDVLDSQANFDEAKKQLLFYVHLNKWDLESDVAIEFIRKVERRYN